MAAAAPFDIKVDFKEIGAMEDSLRDAANFGVKRAMRAGFAAFGGIVAERAREIAPRDKDGIRSAASLAQGPLHRNTTFRATSDYVDIVAPGYARFVDDGQYLRDALDDVEDEALREFGEAAADEIGLELTDDSTFKERQRRRDVIEAAPAEYRDLFTRALIQSLALGLAIRWARGNPWVLRNWEKTKTGLQSRRLWVHRTTQVSARRLEGVRSGERWQDWVPSRRKPASPDDYAAMGRFGKIREWGRGHTTNEETGGRRIPEMLWAVGPGRMMVGLHTQGRRTMFDSARAQRLGYQARRFSGAGGERWWMKPKPVSKPVLLWQHGRGRLSETVWTGRAHTARWAGRAGRAVDRVGIGVTTAGLKAAARAAGPGASAIHRVGRATRSAQRRFGTAALTTSSFLERRVVWRVGAYPHRRAIAGAAPSAEQRIGAWGAKAGAQAARLTGRWKTPPSPLLEPRFDVYGGWSRAAGRQLDTTADWMKTAGPGLGIDPAAAQASSMAYRVYAAPFHAFGRGIEEFGRGVASATSGIRRAGFASREAAAKPISADLPLLAWRVRAWQRIEWRSPRTRLGYALAKWEHKTYEQAVANRRMAQTRYAALWEQQERRGNWLARQQQAWENTLKRGTEFDLTTAFTRSGPQVREPYQGLVFTIRGRAMPDQFDTRAQQRAFIRYEQKLAYWEAKQARAADDLTGGVSALRHWRDVAVREARWAGDAWRRRDRGRNLGDGLKQWDIDTGRIVPGSGRVLYGYDPNFPVQKARLFQRQSPQVNLPVILPGRKWFNLQLGVARRRPPGVVRLQAATGAPGSAERVLQERRAALRVIAAEEELAEAAADKRAWLGLRERLRIDLPGGLTRPRPLTIRFGGKMDLRGRPGPENILRHKSTVIIQEGRDPISRFWAPAGGAVERGIRRRTPKWAQQRVADRLDERFKPSPVLFPWADKPAWYERWWIQAKEAIPEPGRQIAEAGEKMGPLWAKLQGYDLPGGPDWASWTNWERFRR